MQQSTILTPGRGARPKDTQAVMFDDLVALVARRMQMPVAILVLPDLQRPGQNSISTHGLPNPETYEETIAFGAHLMDALRRSQRPLVLSDSRMQTELGALPLVQNSQCLAFLCVPVLSADSRMIGVLCVANKTPFDWSEGDIEALKDYATLISREMRQRLLVSDQSAELSMLRLRLERERLHNFQREAIFQAMATPGLSPSARFRSVLNAGCAALKVDYGILTQVSGGRARVIAASKSAPTNEPLADIEISQRYTADILATDRQICMPDTAMSCEPLRRDLFGRPPLAYFGAPIVTNGLTFGTLEFTATSPISKRSDPSYGSVLSMMAIAINGYLCARTDPQQADVFIPTARAAI
ncbi:GAF domain-containing protein [Marinibacterium profundimaris]|uniref:GAF domain-containing protein n=1 Tax=Marinibacterium profundimaris TaxID=1679460 RepID=A0A225NI68_9RHOB|nr:GAF domain-containing protein [Marinibacterium profundimaris]OWU73506.1 hypothetical protein ATO3_12660 [Marinibacterium profundimaris]